MPKRGKEEEDKESVKGKKKKKELSGIKDSLHLLRQEVELPSTETWGSDIGL